MKPLTLLSLLIFCCSCSTVEPALDKNNEAPEDQATLITPCQDPRPQICTSEYRPVCATKDTGIRCVTTPCPSTEEATYATGCTACSDSRVGSYRPGKCEE